MKTMRTIKNPGTYIRNIEDKAGYLDAITVEHRSNNPKRDFLFVNKLQCKHIPCKPSDMIGMCKKLATIVNKKLAYKYININKYKDLNILIVGFAETATAIGTIVGNNINKASYILHTTRENVIGSKKAITFEEEHSHATTQKLLVTDNFDFNEYNYILFVEDEISTGNTILNFINAFEEQHNLDSKGQKIRDIKYGVASICNWQDKKMHEEFKLKGIDTFALITGELKDASIKMFNNEEIVLIDGVVRGAKSKAETSSVVTRVSTFLENRTGHCVNREALMQKKFKEIYNNYREYNSIRVIGTEECMETAIMIGKYFEDRGHEVVCHATTRSKIDVLDSHFDGEADGIKSRYKVPSVYDADRDTYIYNMNEYYDLILLVTDSKSDECVQKLVDRLIDICNADTKHIGVARV